MVSVADVLCTDGYNTSHTSGLWKNLGFKLVSWWCENLNECWGYDCKILRQSCQVQRSNQSYKTKSWSGIIDQCRWWLLSWAVIGTWMLRIWLQNIEAINIEAILPSSKISSERINKELIWDEAEQSRWWFGHKAVIEEMLMIWKFTDQAILKI
jgi:hypothetical protein